MKRGGGKRKGNTFERWTAKILSQWYFDDPNVLIRTQGSGSMSTVRQAAVGLNDIVQVQPHERAFPFCVECKHLAASVTLPDLFRPTSLFRKAWVQAMQAAALVPGTIPLLVFRANNQPVLVTYPRWLLAGHPYTLTTILWQDEAQEWVGTSRFEEWLQVLDRDDRKYVLPTIAPKAACA
jgi:hypothetical protein